MASVVASGFVKGTQKLLDNRQARNALTFLAPFNLLALPNLLLFSFVYVITFIIVAVVQPDIVNVFTRSQKKNLGLYEVDVGKLFLYSLLFTLLPYYILSLIMNKVLIESSRKVLSLIS
jgi:hypothetical protein